MESSTLFTLLLLSILSFASAADVIKPDCGTCPHPPTTKPPTTKPPGGGILPPVSGIVPPVVGNLPPVTGVVPPVVGHLPPVPGVVPPVTGAIPPVAGVVPPVTGLVPPVTGLVPPVTGLVPPVTGLVPPVTGLVPGVVPPVTGGTPPTKKPCPTPAPKKPKKKDTCPLNALKLGACVDLLGGLVHVGVGDPAVNKCCPIISGLAEVEAAACLCTTLKIKALNLKLYVPIALQLLITCGKTPPPGFTCAL